MFERMPRGALLSVVKWTEAVSKAYPFRLALDSTQPPFQGYEGSFSWNKAAGAWSWKLDSN
jgi:hypothetical protein